MSLVDELTDGPVDSALPAPSGLPAPAGQQPIVPPPLLPPAATPSGPRLPPREARSAGPPTGQVGITGITGIIGITVPAAFLAQSATAAPTKEAPRPNRKRKRLIAVGIAVVVLGVTAFTVRDSRLGDRFTGHGYDNNPLPLQAFPPPSFAGVDYTVSYQSVGIDNGLATNFWSTEHDEVNYTLKVAKVTLDRAKASIIGGTIGTPQSISPPQELVFDERSMYAAGAASTDPWTRSPAVTTSASAKLSKGDVYMYQDVIDPALRAQRPAEVVDEVRHDVPVTTYSYKFAFGTFYESAPRLFDLVHMMDGNAADDADVRVTISIDEHWMVRYLDVELDHKSVLDHRAELDAGNQYRYRYTVDVLSITETPASIPVPTNTVDATTTTVIPTTTTVVP